jgi:hypothetical protein
MKVIALRGNPNQGKSTTLNIAYQFMLLNGFIQVPGHFRVLGNPVQKDFIDILKIENKIVGIATMGDYSRKGYDSVKELLTYLDSQKCDVAICACNLNKAGTLSAVSNYPNHFFVDKTITSVESKIRIINGADAEKVYTFI